MDRVAPSRRPDRPIVGHQRWRDLLFLHWQVEEAEVRALVPDALDIDTFEGRAFVGLVPFEMFGVRPAWWPERIGLAFPETNVRTYVHRRGRDPGVYFFSLDAASRLAVHAARLRWGLPYFHAAMQVEHRAGEISYRLERRSGSRPSLFLRYAVGAAREPAEPGTLDHFLIERYLLHVTRGGRVYTGQVHHAPYPLRHAELLELRQELVAAAGLTSAGAPLVHYAAGVDVDIFELRRAPPSDQGSR